MQQIFPEEIIQFSTEALFHRNTVRGHVIYLTTILLVILICASLPFIRVDSTISCRGILVTREQSASLLSPVSGKVEFISLKKNDTVSAGDTLLIIEHHSLSEELLDIQKTIDLISMYYQDLEELLNGGPEISSDRYKMVSAEYTFNKGKLENEQRYYQNEYVINKQLYDEGFIAKTEFELIERQYLGINASCKILETEFNNRCLSEYSEYELELIRLNTRKSNLLQSIDRHILCAPLTGFIADYQELKIGSNISQGTVVGRIIPDQELVAECLLMPDQISRVFKGQDITLNIDAFPGHIWGRIEGVVTEIPEDVSNVSGNPVYRITCNIQQQFDNNHCHTPARLKNGMTFTGLFILNRKSLLQLLIEKTEKLLTPAIRTTYAR